MEVTQRMRTTGMFPKGWIPRPEAYVWDRARATGMMPSGWIPPMSYPPKPRDEVEDEWEVV